LILSRDFYTLEQDIITTIVITYLGLFIFYSFLTYLCFNFSARMFIGLIILPVWAYLFWGFTPDILLYGETPYHLFVFYIVLACGFFLLVFFLFAKLWSNKRTWESFKFRVCTIISIIYICLFDEWYAHLVFLLWFRIVSSYIFLFIILFIISKLRK